MKEWDLENTICWFLRFELVDLLATFFNIEISGLADRFLIEIGTNVNCRWRNGSFER
jgi:hypothetical protein